MRLFIKVGIVAPILAMTCIVKAGEPRETPRPPIETVPFCRLAKQWQPYNGQVIRTTAIYVSGPEITELYHPQCPAREDRIWADFTSGFKIKTPPTVLNNLDATLRSNGRAYVDIIAEFHGPKTVEIPPNIPADEADLMRSVNSRYGHLNQFRFEMRLLKIERVQPVSADQPWPSEEIDKEVPGGIEQLPAQDPRNEPGVFVTLDKVISGKPVFQGETGKRMVLRLHNNYSFDIEVPTFDLGSGLIGVTYEVKALTEDSGAEKTPAGYSEEVVTMDRVEPGQALVFSVPAEHLSDATYLQIPFIIEWETKARQGEAAPLHFAVFYGSSLPKVSSEQ